MPGFSLLKFTDAEASLGTAGAFAVPVSIIAFIVHEQAHENLQQCRI
jgi:hypothetical protein